MCLGEIRGRDVKEQQLLRVACESAQEDTAISPFLPSVILSFSPLNLLTQQRKNAADVNSETSCTPVIKTGTSAGRRHAEAFAASLRLGVMQFHPVPAGGDFFLCLS